MKIIKKINTSAAFALDSTGREVVVVGKGIGFPPVPYELTDLSAIERTFYDVDPKYIGILSELPKELLVICADIAEQAEIELNCELNQNLPFTLADHLNFAHERLKKGISLTMPIAYDVRYLYPKEYALGRQALKMLEEQIGLFLPESEAVSIAMHLINAQAQCGNLHDLMMTMQIISQIVAIVEERFETHIDRESYSYSRFTSHLRYLIQRLQSSEKPASEEKDSVLNTLRREYPRIYDCTRQITEYLLKTWGWTCNEEEMVYLMMHIHRVIEKN